MVNKKIFGRKNYHIQKNNLSLTTKFKDIKIKVITATETYILAKNIPIKNKNIINKTIILFYKIFILRTKSIFITTKSEKQITKSKFIKTKLENKITKLEFIKTKLKNRTTKKFQLQNQNIFKQKQKISLQK